MAFMIAIFSTIRPSALLLSSLKERNFYCSGNQQQNYDDDHDDEPSYQFKSAHNNSPIDDFFSVILTQIHAGN